MNNEMKKGPLLKENGDLCEAGFAYSLIKDYDRKAIKNLKWRIKEWDYYAILTDEYGIALTVADNSYMSLVSVSYLDFKTPSYVTKSFMGWFTFGKLNLPGTSKEGDIIYSKKGYEFSFKHENGKRHLVVKYPKFKDGLDFSCDVELTETNKDSMVIATPFNKKGHFYYNQKINCLQANGSFTIGKETKRLDNAVGVLDWGRGTWTYKNTWYWGSLSIKDNEGYKGFNLGYGFGDTSAASENMLFFNDQAYKLDEVEFQIPHEGVKYDYLKPWKIVSKDLSINLTFTPIIDRADETNVIIICSKQHQVFGKFNGTITKGDVVCKFNNALGFAERVYNKW